jgi:hypothetical protein
VLARVHRRLLPLLLLAVLVAGGCQMQVAVDIKVDEDGSGLVTVGVGLDDDALARAGNLDEQLRVDDLRAAGWYVPAPSREGDVTWVRASKPFATPDQARAVFEEITGPDGAFRQFEVTRDESAFGTSYRVRGVVDLTDGPGSFSDAELTAALEGDPFGGSIEAAEREEGRSVAEMVRFRVAVDLPGAAGPKVFEPSLSAEEATVIDASSNRSSLLATAWIWLLGGLVGLVTLVVLRKGFTRLRA